MLAMPAGHSQAELEMARRISRHLGSAELHVLWCSGPPDAGSLPPAAARDVPTLARGLALFGAVLEAAASALGRRLSA